MGSERTPELHGAIMNIPCKTPASENAYGAYERGHRDARHAAAELAHEFLAAAIREAVGAERAAWLAEPSAEVVEACAKAGWNTNPNPPMSWERAVTDSHYLHAADEYREIAHAAIAAFQRIRSGE